MNQTSLRALFIGGVCSLLISGCSIFPDRIKDFSDLWSDEETTDTLEDPLLAEESSIKTVRPEGEEERRYMREQAQENYMPDSRDEAFEEQEYEMQRYARQSKLQTRFSPDVTHKQLYDYASQLAMELVESATRLNSRSRVGVASFVRLNRSLQEPTVVGNQLSEFMMGELQTFGLNVVDFKLTQAITVTSFGDLAMSRDARELASETGMDHILTGTMIEDARGVRVNARIVSVESQQMVASASIHIPAFIVQNLYSHLGE